LDRFETEGVRGKSHAKTQRRKGRENRNSRKKAQKAQKVERLMEDVKATGIGIENCSTGKRPPLFGRAYFFVPLAPVCGHFVFSAFPLRLCVFA
jgi:hypothetical protein